MAITLSNDYRNACLTGSGGANLMNGGKLEVYTTGQGVLVVEYTLAATAFAIGGTPGQADLQGGPFTDDALADATMADYVFKDSSNNIHITGTNEVTLTGGGGSLIFSGGSLTVTTGQTITFNSYSITQPAS